MTAERPTAPAPGAPPASYELHGPTSKPVAAIIEPTTGSHDGRSASPDTTAAAAATRPADTPADVPAGAQAHGPGRLVLAGLRRYSLVLLLGISIAVYGLWNTTSDVFLTAADFRNILSSQAVLVAITMGLLMPMIAGSIDLSVGSIAGLSSVITAGLLGHNNLPLWLALILGVLVGAVAGAVNGACTVLFKVDSFIITLGTASVIAAIVDLYTNGLSIAQGIPQSLLTFGRSDFVGIPNVVWVAAAAALVVWYILEQTPFGRNLHAIGSNKDAARLVGIRVERHIFSAFVLAGAFSGLAGVLLLMISGSGNPQVGQGYTLTAIAAAFLGGAAFKVGQLNVPGSVVAILFLAVNITGLTFGGVASWIGELFTGVSLVIAVAFASILHHERRRRAPGTGRAARSPRRSARHLDTTKGIAS